jgi:hypothetical protein
MAVKNFDSQIVNPKSNSQILSDFQKKSFFSKKTFFLKTFICSKAQQNEIRTQRNTKALFLEKYIMANRIAQKSSKICAFILLFFIRECVFVRSHSGLLAKLEFLFALLFLLIYSVVENNPFTY